MDRDATGEANTSASRALKSALKSQYHAALAMLREAIEKCPDALWASDEYTNRFWRIAYHALYFMHLYLQPTVHDFRPWEHHQTSIQDMDDVPSPPDIMDLTELPHRPPQTGEPYSKARVLEYWELCDAMIDDSVDRLDVFALDSGFSWYKIPKIEHQMVNLRHIQHHTGQLTDRIRNEASMGVDWAGARGRRQFPG